MLLVPLYCNATGTLPCTVLLYGYGYRFTWMSRMFCVIKVSTKTLLAAESAFFNSLLLLLFRSAFYIHIFQRKIYFKYKTTLFWFFFFFFFFFRKPDVLMETVHSLKNDFCSKVKSGYTSHYNLFYMNTCRAPHIEMRPKYFTMYSDIPSFRADPLRWSLMRVWISDCNLQCYDCYLACATWNYICLGARSLCTVQLCTSLQCHFSMMQTYERVHGCLAVTCHLYF